jgi:hypothetical protein
VLPALLDTAEAAILIGIDQTTLTRAQSEDPPFYPIGEWVGSRLVFDAEAVLEFCRWNQSTRRGGTDLSYEKQIVRSREKAIRPHRVVTLSERGVKRNGSVPDEAVVPVTGEASRKTTGPARKPRHRHSDKMKVAA